MYGTSREGVGTNSVRKRAPIDGENRLQDLTGARLADGHTIRAAGSKEEEEACVCPCGK
ncbi:unnamed protein product, partial [Ectocarpus sp. 6 AP-2014]